MSTAVLAAGPAAPAGRRGSLLRAEARRFRSRRMVRVLLALALLGLLAAVAIASTQFAKPSAAGLADAARQRDQVAAQQRQFRAQCLAGTPPDGVPVEAYCGPEQTADDLGTVEDFIAKRPFTMDSAGRAGVLGVAAATAALAFLLGATYVGAEWSTRSMVALLFWEPRRLVVMASKLTVLVGATALLGVLAEGLWLLAARVLAAARGTTAVPQHLTSELLTSAGRGVVLVVLFALLGFGIANLLRNTAAAFGFAFVYFAILETVLRQVRPAWQPYLLTDSAVALLLKGGNKVFVDQGYVDARGFYVATGREIMVSNLHGAVVLAVVSLAVVALGVLLFTRRDLD